MILILDNDRIISVNNCNVKNDKLILNNSSIKVVMNKCLRFNKGALSKRLNSELSKHAQLVDLRGFVELDEEDFAKNLQTYTNSENIKFTRNDSSIPMTNWHIKGIKFFTGTEVFILDALKNPVAEIVNRLKNNPESVDISDLIVE